MDSGDRNEDAITASLRDLAWRQVDASVVITGRAGRIVDWNDGATRLFGWTAQEAIGATWEDLAGPVAADPDPRRAQVRDRLEAATPFTGELTVATKSRTRIPILVTAGPVRDEAGEIVGTIWIAIDDRRRSLAEERFEVAFRESPVASVITTGVRQLILDVNPAFEQLSDFDRQDVIGRTSDELGLWDDPETSAAMLDLTRAHARITDASVAFRTRRGVIVQTRLSGRPIQLADGPAYLWMAVDETDRLRATEHLQRTQRLEAIGLLAGGIAHDFNNVMTTIGGTASLAARHVGPDHPIAPDLDQIVRSIERAVSLTQQLLAFSGRIVLRPERLDLLTIAQEMAPTLSRLAPPGSQVLVTGETGAGRIQADPGQIRQVLLNLAVNAFDAMPAGGTLRIDVAGHGGTGPADPVRVRLRVSDDGAGMSDAVLGRLFEPFFTTKPIGQGTGLGLAVVHGIVEQSGGSIDVASAPGKGSTFTIDLPPDEAALETDSSSAGPLADDRVATILVVEDDSAVRMLARRVLERRGHRVVEAEDGVAGLDALADLASLDLILTDLTMPRMGGIAMAARISELRPDVPVIFMSGYGESALAQDGVLDPSIRLLSKPFAIDDLAGIVHRTLAERT